AEGEECLRGTTRHAERLDQLHRHDKEREDHEATHGQSPPFPASADRPGSASSASSRSTTSRASRAESRSVRSTEQSAAVNTTFGRTALGESEYSRARAIASPPCPTSARPQRAEKTRATPFPCAAIQPPASLPSRRRTRNAITTAKMSWVLGVQSAPAHTSITK